MALVKFNRELFHAKHATAKETGGFQQVIKGNYIATLKKSYSKFAKTNGQLMACLSWQISEDDDKFPNHYIFENILLTNAEGENSDMGYQILASKIAQLKVPYTPDEELDTILERAIGTKCRLNYTPQDEENQYQKVYINKLIAMPDGSETVAGYMAPDSQSPETEVEQVEHVVLASGMIIILEGTGERLEIIELLETTDPMNTTGVEAVFAKTPGGKMSTAKVVPKSMIADAEMPAPGNVAEDKPVTAIPPASTTQPATNVNATPDANELDSMPTQELQEETVEEESEVVEEEDAGPIYPILGSKATGQSAKTGKTVTGVIAANTSNPNDGLIVIQDGKIAYRCKPETVKVG